MDPSLPTSGFTDLLNGTPNRRVKQLLRAQARGRGPVHLGPRREPALSPHAAREATVRAGNLIRSDGD